MTAALGMDCWWLWFGTGTVRFGGEGVAGPTRASAGPTRGAAVSRLCPSSEEPFSGNPRVPTSVRRFLLSVVGAPRIYPEPRAAGDSQKGRGCMPGLSPRRYKAHPRFRGQPAVWGPLGQDRGPGFVDGDTYFVIITHLATAQSFPRVPEESPWAWPTHDR